VIRSREKRLLRQAIADLHQFIFELDPDPDPDVGAYIADRNVANAARRAVAAISERKT
jgi:hypothetical protein